MSTIVGFARFVAVAAIVTCNIASLQGDDSQTDNSVPHWMAGEALRKALDDNSKLKALVVSPDSVVAVHSAWRRSEARILDRAQSSGRNLRSEENLAYFLGFIEGRSQIACPEWWKNAISSAHLDAHGTLTFRVDSDERKRVRLGDLLGPGDATASLEPDGGLHVAVGGQSIRITKRNVDVGKSNSNASRLEVSLSNTAQLVGWVSNNDTVYLMRLEQGAEEKWSAHAKGFWAPGFSSGPGEVQRVEITTTKSSVTVFAASSEVVYAETFAIDTGTRLFRLSTGATR